MTETAATTNELFGLYSHGLTGIMSHRDVKPMEAAMRRVFLAVMLVAWDTAAIAAGSAWTTVRCAAESSFLINAKGDLYATGHRLGGNLGDGRGRVSPLSLQVFLTKWKKVLSRVSDVSPATTHSAALRSNGTVWLTGNNEFGQLGQRKLTYFFRWKRSKLPTRAKVVGIGTRFQTSYVVTADDVLWVVGWSELGTQTRSGAYQISPKWQISLRDTVRVEGVENGALAWRQDGKVWRITYYPDLTDFGLDPHPPAHWQPITLVGDIVTAQESTAAGAHLPTGNGETGTEAGIQLLTASGNLYTYSDSLNDGIPDDQQDGLGNIIAAPKPTSDYLTVSDIGIDALRTNDFGVFSLTHAGQLQYMIPKQLITPLTVIPAYWQPVLSDVRSFCVGAKHALAIRTDGTVWAAGGNESGQFGNGTTTGTTGATDWIQILQ